MSDALLQPSAVLLCGTNCVGKSTLSRALAEALPGCSVLEIDKIKRELNQKNPPPDLASREIFLQACKECLALAAARLRRDRIVVIDGLAQVYTCSPEAKQSFRNAVTLSVGVCCSPAVLRSRWRERGWSAPPLNELTTRFAWYSANMGRFDCVIDTASTTVVAAVERIIVCLNSKAAEGQRDFAR